MKAANMHNARPANCASALRILSNAVKKLWRARRTAFRRQSKQEKKRTSGSRRSLSFWFGPAVHKGDVDVRLDPSVHRDSGGRHRDSDGDPAGHVLSGAD